MEKEGKIIRHFGHAYNFGREKHQKERRLGEERREY